MKPHEMKAINLYFLSMKNKTSYYDTFGLPVIETSPDLKEAYLNVIAKPMCFTDLEKNYQTKLYTTFEEFQIDLKLIWDNCKLFNEPGSAVYKKAKNLQAFTTKFFNKHLKQVDNTECTTVDVALKMKRKRNDDEEEGGGYGVKTRSRSKNENKVETSSVAVVDVEEEVKVEEDEESKRESQRECKRESKEKDEHNEHNGHNEREEEVKMKKIEKEKEKYVDRRKPNAIVMNNRCNNVTTVKRKNYVPLPLKMFNRKKSALVMNGKVVTHINKMHFQRGVIGRQQQHKQKMIKDEVKKPQKIIDDDSDNENNNNSKNNNNNIHPITKDKNKESTPIQQQPTQTKSSPSPIISPSQPEPSPLITPLTLPPPQLPLPPPPSVPSPPQDQPLIATKPKYIDDKEKLQLSVLISKLSEDGLLNFLVKVDGLSQNLIEVYKEEQICFKVERISKDIYQTIFSDLSEILQAEREAQKALGTFK